MSMFTCLRQRFDDQVCYPDDLPRPDLRKVKRNPLEAGPLQIKNASNARPDNRRASVHGNSRQPSSAWGV